MNKKTYDVIIDNIKVDGRYYSFDYKIYINWVFEIEWEYNSDFSIEKDKLIEYLENGYAHQLALERLF